MIGDAVAVGMQFRPQTSWVVGTRVSELFAGNAPIEHACVAQKFADI